MPFQSAVRQITDRVSLTFHTISPPISKEAVDLCSVNLAKPEDFSKRFFPEETAFSPFMDFAWGDSLRFFSLPDFTGTGPKRTTEALCSANLPQLQKVPELFSFFYPEIILQDSQVKEGKWRAPTDFEKRLISLAKELNIYNWLEERTLLEIAGTHRYLHRVSSLYQKLKELAQAQMFADRLIEIIRDSQTFKIMSDRTACRMFYQTEPKTGFFEAQPFADANRTIKLFQASKNADLALRVKFFTASMLQFRKLAERDKNFTCSV